MKENAMSLVHETDYGTPRAKAQKQVTLTIDGHAVTVPEGTSIMRAAMEMGTQIPKLCATDMLDAFGSCRLCLVEIEGRAGTPASCTTPVAPGMAVKTQTERLKRLRKGVMELYISDHPLDCLTCAANGDCELQDMAGAVGLRDVRYGYGGDKHPNPGKDESNPYFTYDPSKCIVCSRCVRACEEVQGTFALTIAGRGFGSVVSPGMEESFLASECVSCGACVQACPTATLTEKSVIAIGQPEHSVVTTCAYCGVGCAFKAEMRGDEVVRMVPYKDGKANAAAGPRRPIAGARRRPAGDRIRGATADHQPRNARGACRGILASVGRTGRPARGCRTPQCAGQARRRARARPYAG
jgi:formate dehydrogenase major subunit